MKTFLLFLSLLLLPALPAAWAAPDIKVQGRFVAGIVTWPDIDNNDLVADQTVTNFGTVLFGETGERIFRIRNTGNQTLTVTSVTSSSTQWTFPDLPGGGDNSFNVAPGDNREFTIVYRPVTSSSTPTITIRSNDPDADDPYRFAITGEGEGPEIAIGGSNVEGGPFSNITDGGGNTPSVATGTNFGSQDIDAGNVVRYFRVTNSGTSGLNLQAPQITGAGADHFSISGLNSAINVGAGNTRDFEIRYNPSSIGTHNAVITIGNNDADEDPFTFEVTGTGTGNPDARVQGYDGAFWQPIADADLNPDQGVTDFGKVDVGTDRTRRYRMQNQGNAPLTVSNITSSNARFSVDGSTSFTVPAGEDREFVLRFSPLARAVANATITLTTNDPDGGNPYTFAVTGTGQGPEFDLSGSGVDGVFRALTDGGLNSPAVSNGTDFGDVNVTGPPASRSFRITNNGDTALTISDRDFTGAAAADFDVSGLLIAGTRTIGPGNSITFTISFDPSLTGTRNAVFYMRSNDTDEDPYTINLTGNGVGFPEIEVQGTRPGEPLVQITDGETAPRQAEGTLFADTDVGSDRTSNFRLRNTGDANLTLSAPILSGINPNQFTTLNFSTAALAPGEVLNFNIRFRPTSFGTKSAVFSVVNNDSNESPFNFTIRGTGEAPVMTVMGNGNASQYGLIANGDTTPRVEDGTDFGEVRVGNKPFRTFRIDNNGNKPLNISRSSFSGTFGDQFDVSQLNAGNPLVNIQPGESQTFRVTFQPTSPGVKITTLSLESNDPNESPYTFVIRGTGYGEADIRIRGLTNLNVAYTINDGDLVPNQDVTRFGRVTPGTTRDRNFRVLNDGDDTLTITSAVSSNPRYTILGLAVSLPPGGSDDFVIRFSPNVIQEENTIISISNNTPGLEAVYSFALTGEGSAPDILVQGGFSQAVSIQNGDTTPRTQDGTLFGPVNANGGSQVAPFTIRNTGSEAIIITGRSVTGAHASDFILRQLVMPPPPLMPITIPPGGEKPFEVEFIPTATGVRNAVINLQTNDPDESPYTFAVQGNAEPPPAGVPVMALRGTSPETINSGDTTPSLTDGTHFGTLTPAGAPLVRSFLIINTGAAPLLLAGVASTSPAFVLSTLPASVGTGSSASLEITFNPQVSGSGSSVITIYNNDPQRSAYTFTVTVTVTGQSPAGRVTSMTLDDGAPAISFTGDPAKTYRIATSTNLSAWSPVPGFSSFPGTASPQTLVLPYAADPDTDPVRFFRVEEEP